ncbi:hypothetical protein CONPUDRAFT_164368 [Coniophora puteana RWD-64-598 SS2]|uniref:Uncharacterized protein n=1 Tax=Coniophora puteana (strain RWD-64-598) TaxID=741705 RepID=A0A5M3MXA9_CONPW|nr:uncharacterized protein CONPUDRAFT_164368 [Coniophora puteana RWD-64-598 SS2]EIW83414.1 hypothetical protein CONPUDRAFT_164368 [Coniophora puteana RWD-64-598 SS2]
MHVSPVPLVSARSLAAAHIAHEIECAVAVRSLMDYATALVSSSDWAWSTARLASSDSCWARATAVSELVLELAISRNLGVMNVGMSIRLGGMGWFTDQGSKRTAAQRALVLELTLAGNAFVINNRTKAGEPANYTRVTLLAPEIRSAFVRTVYTILSAGRSTSHVPLFDALVNLGLLYWKRHSHPSNLVLLSTFTLLEAFTLGIVTASFVNIIVLTSMTSLVSVPGCSAVLAHS